MRSCRSSFWSTAVRLRRQRSSPAVLQDTKRAKIVGKRSYGKGSVQEPFSSLDGSSLLLTVRRYETVGGQRPDGVGIKPDVVIKAATSKAKRHSTARPAGRSEDHALSEAVELLGRSRRKGSRQLQ